MDRFVAMIWDEEDQSRQALVNAWSEGLERRTPRWRRVLEQPGLRVMSYVHRGDEPVVTRWRSEDGIVIGALFRRGDEARGRIKTLERDVCRRIGATRGDELAKAYWGSFVAVWRDPATQTVSVLRDACGGAPCFLTEQSGVQLAFAHAEDVADLPGLRFTTDWTYLQSFILFNYFITRHTGLNEVKELLGGERMEHRRGEAPRMSWAWNGAAFAANPNRQTFADAKAEFRETAEACFTAWGKEYRNVLVSLSGGLDSSILANLLRRVSDGKITALHHVGRGYESYEAKLARLAAEHAGIELIEAELDPEKNDTRAALAAPRSVRPKLQVFSILIDRVAAASADRVGADCFMAGQGGDNIFIQRSGANRTLADHVRLNGITGDIWRLAYDSALLQRGSVWKALEGLREATAFRKPWRPYEFLGRPEAIRHRPLTMEAVASLPEAYQSHPWLAEAGRMPPNKADHLLSIVALYNYHTHHGRGIDRDVLHPFFSQPIVELALRTPTYILAEGGIDRAIERAAFGDLIPDVIARRVDKGGADAFAMQVMKRNLPFYREMILEGELIRSGWFEKEKIERMVSEDYMVHGAGKVFVMLAAAAEVWLRSWRSDRMRAAA